MRNSKNILKSEGGQILIYVLIAALVAVLVVPPLIGLTYSGYRSAAISKDKMVEFYAADSGIEDAIYQIVNRGNDTPPEQHNAKVPVDFGPANSITYWLGDNPVTPEVEKTEINDCYVQLNIERVSPGNDTYVVQSTSTDIKNEAQTKSIIQAMIVIGTGNQTLEGEGPGPGGVSPFSYAMASLDPDATLIIEGPAAGNPSEVYGDIYSSGDMEIDPWIYIAPDPESGRPSSVWANGNLKMGHNSSVSGDAHSSGDMTLDYGAWINFNAYSGGDITLADTSSSSAAGIGNSSYAMGDITLYNSSTIGNRTEAGGNINVHGKFEPPAAGILGNAYAAVNIVGDGHKNDSAIIYGDATAGGSISPETLKWIIIGTSYPNTPPTLSPMPPLPVLTNPSIEYWRLFYKQEAHGGNITPNPDEWPYPDDLCPVYGPPVNYESGTIYLKEQPEWHLGPLHVTADPGELGIDGSDASNIRLYLDGTVYVDGSVELKNKNEIIGGGKLVATGDITLYNSAISSGTGDTVPLIMSIYGSIEVQNLGDGGIIDAVLYAPNGSIDIGIGQEIMGSVVGQSVENKGKIILTYDQRVQSIPGLPGGWEPGNGTVPTQWVEYLPAGVYIEWYNVLK